MVFEVFLLRAHRQLVLLEDLHETEIAVLNILFHRDRLR